MRRDISWLRVLTEVVVIVGSILLAFAIDAWWEGRQEDKRRRELIEALDLDFELTRTRLAESIALADSLVTRSRGFLDLAEHSEGVSLDSMRFLAFGALFPIDFEPALAAYEGAVTTGDLGLLQSRALSEAFAEFRQAWDFYEDHDRIHAALFFSGAIWELRRELGSLGVLLYDPEVCPPDLYTPVCPYPRQFQVADADFRSFVARPDVYAAVETVMIACRQILRGLHRMDDAAGQVLEELARLR